MRFNKGAPDVMVPHQRESEFQPRLRGVADGRRDAGIGHRHDDVGVRRAFPRQLFAHPVTALVDAPAEDYRIRAREIDMLEDAMRYPLRLERVERMQAARIDYDDLSGFDVADVARADQVEGACLRREYRGPVEFAHAERAKSARVAHGYDALGRGEKHREGALVVLQRLDDRVDDVPLSGAGDPVQHDFGVGGRRKDRAFHLEPISGLGSVGQISVVAERDLTEAAFDQERLCLVYAYLAGRRITHVADGGAPGQSGKALLLKDVIDMPHPALGAQRRAVSGDYPGRLLAAVLQRVQAEIGQARRFLMAENAEDTTLFSEFIEHN